MGREAGFGEFRRPPASTPGTRWLVALALLIALGAACTSPASDPGDDETATGESTLTSTPSPSPRLSGTPRPPIPDAGVWVIDAETGAIAKLIEVDDDSAGVPSTTGFGAASAVWVTGVDGVARRYLPDGMQSESIPDVIVTEASDPTVRLLAADGGRTLRLEANGEQRLLTRSGFYPSFAPDASAILFLEQRDPDDFALVVARVDGERETLLTDVQLCQCDEAPRPAWSPSGEFIAVNDFGPVDGGESEERGSYVVRSDGRGPPSRVSDSPGASLGWLRSEDATLLLQVVSEPRLYDAASGESRPLLSSDEVARGTARLSPDGRSVQIWTPDGGTSLTDPSVGSTLERWSERGIATLTPFGPALSVEGPEVTVDPIAGCWGVWLEHPSLPEAECVRGAERVLWTSDGSLLALLSDRGPFDRWLEFWTFGEQPLRVLVRPTARLVEWSADGRYLLVTWGLEG